MILVLGATGKTGRLVAGELGRRGLAVRGASRSLGFDWHAPATWRLTGVHAAYLVTPQQADFPPELVEDFVTRADAAGVRRLVLLSGLSAGYGSEPMLSRERPVRAARAAWTVLRPGSFSQNFAPGGPYHREEVRLPLGPEPRAAFIDVRDIADVAVAALTGDGHEGRTYDLSGPRAPTFAEALATVSATARYVDVPEREWLAGRTPDAALNWSLETFEAIRRGDYARLRHGVQEVLGRNPRDFAPEVRRV